MTISALESLSYQDEGDLIKMESLLIEARSLTSDWRYKHIGELAFNYLMVACHLDPQEHIQLWAVGDRLVAYAILGEDPSFDCQVMPGYEWQGVEEEALNWAETRLIELRRMNPVRWGGDLVSGSRKDDASFIAFLKSHGFHNRGRFAEVNMIRSLKQPIPESSPPKGYHVREIAETGEQSKRAAAHRSVWLPWTDGDISEEGYAHMMQLPGYDRYLDIVTVTPNGEFAAFVHGWPDPINKIGDFGPVGALPEFRRQGLTRLSLLEGLRRMKERDMDRVCVSTTISNSPARNLYESVGFTAVNQYLDFVKPAQ